MALYAFDGTWNDSSAPEEQRDTKKDSNVHRFRVLYGRSTGEKTENLLAYTRQVCTWARYHLGVVREADGKSFRWDSGDAITESQWRDRESLLQRLHSGARAWFMGHAKQARGSWLLHPSTVRWLPAYTVIEWSAPHSEK